MSCHTLRPTRTLNMGSMPKSLLLHIDDRLRLCIHFVCLRIIKESALGVFGTKHPKSRPGLEVWRKIMLQERFIHFADLRRCFRSADQVRVESGKPVVVFNIHGNDYRLICAIHYNKGKGVFTAIPLAR
jgi:mRNA interferase HigB